MTLEEFITRASKYDPNIVQDVPYLQEVLGMEISAVSPERFDQLAPTFGAGVGGLNEIRMALIELSSSLQYDRSKAKGLRELQEGIWAVAPRVLSDEVSTAESRLMTDELLSPQRANNGFSNASALFDEANGLLIHIKVELWRGILQLAGTHPNAVHISSSAVVPTRH